MSRLVVADVTWAYCRFPLQERPEEQVWTKYKSLLSGLLALPEDSYGVSPAGAWILHDPQLSDVLDAAKRTGSKLDSDPIFAPYRWFQSEQWLLQEPQRMTGAESATCQLVQKPEMGNPGLWWRSGAGAQRTVGFIASGLEQCGRVSTRAWMEHQEALLAAQMNLFTCRIYLTPKQAVRLTGQMNLPMPPIPIHVCIGLRFKDYLEESFEERLVRYWLYATLSVWTHKPESPQHAPRLSTCETGKRALTRPIGVTAVHKWYTGALREGFKERVRKHFRPAEMEILGREHQPPQFWFAQHNSLPALPKFADNINDVNELTSVLPRAPDVRSTGVAAGLINDRILVLRRYIPDASGELPWYLVIPLEGTASQRENNARELVWGLTDIEASAVAQLFDAMTSLNIYASHLEVYKAIASQADVFWDQLALSLPVAHTSHIHKLIELIHQTLLQGIADLDQVTIQVSEAERKVNMSANDLKDQFDQRFTERPLDWLLQTKDERSIRSSLTETGYFDKAVREAKRIRKDAQRVQHSYNTLLSGMARAFDERRVRGTDVLQRVGFMFAVLVGAAFAVPEAVNAVFTSWMTAQHPGPQGKLLATLSLWAMVAFGLLGLALFLWRWWLSTLGSWWFRRRHRQLKTFLADCATDRLTRLRDAGWIRVHEALNNPSKEETSAWGTFFAEWDALDRKLAHQCADLLDQLTRDEVLQSTWTNRPPRIRIKDLGRQVERWALKTLLVSERPRQFRQFVLPRLTFLYRFYPMMGGELRSNSFEAPDAEVVSDSDFRFTVENQCSGDHEQIELIKDWAQHQIEQSGFLQPPARRFVKALDQAGLEAGMTRRDFDAMLELMREQLAQS